MDTLIQRYKYGHQLYLARWLGEQMAGALARHLETQAIVTPAPLHFSRLAERGFNQSASLARQVARRCRLPLEVDLCERSRGTVPQATLPYAERHANVRDAFACHADLTGKSVILVDDVMTSGASVNEIARTFKLHGATRVTVLVAARTLHE